MVLTFRKALSPTDFEIGGELFREYAEELDVDLAFQNFSEELNSLEKQYSEPTGSLVIVQSEDNEAIGCFGIRQFDHSTCELKRMYIKSEFRGKGVGGRMLEKSIQIAKKLGYGRMRLDTLPSMEAAIALYIHSGFYPIEAYRHNPIAGSKFLEKDLTD